MAYYVKGKTFTDHPLMDEICYNCKLILKSIVIKNDVLAMEKETDVSLDNAEMYFLFHDHGSISFGAFKFTEEIFKAYGYSDIETKFYLRSKYSIPESDRDNLTTFANNYFKQNYFYHKNSLVGYLDGDLFIEQNDYYRMLMGLPPYGTDEYNVYLVASDIPDNYAVQVDLTIPIHNQPKELINALYEHGTLDLIISEPINSTHKKSSTGSNYSYLRYLGSKAIDLYTARKASKWDILYMPNVYYLVENRFTDLYRVNRDMYMNRSYQQFFAESGVYYDQMMILTLLAETFSNLVTDTPEWYIRRDIFDLRSCKYFLESYGVDYFKIIPLKYQIRIVKNLNKLIKYKSSSQNIADIIDIFDVPNTNVYKYWLYKKINAKDDNGYSLEFISSKYNESYDAYIKDTKYRTPYDDITLQDKYWDGEDTHSYIKEKTLDQEFTIQGTKYMSVEYQVSMKEWLYQTEYMLGLILDSNVYNGLSNVKIAVPSIDDVATFKIADLFLFLVIMSNSYYRTDLSSDETAVEIPDTTEGVKPTVNEKYYDWKKKYFPEIFVQKNGRIHSFNSTLNLDLLIKQLEKRHSHLRFGMPDQDGNNGLTDAEYKIRADEWLTDLGVIGAYTVPGTNINSVDDLVSVYEINTGVYNKVRNAILTAENEDDKKYLEYIYQELFTRPYDISFYIKVKNNSIVQYTDLVQILQDKDYILYDIFYSIMQETNLETKQDMMRSIINDVIETLEYYLSGDGLEYLYSFASISSFGAIVKYIYLMLCFFKSYKVYFLDPYYTLKADDELENTVKPIDLLEEIRIINYKWDKSHVDDRITGMNKSMDLIDEGEFDRMFEMADIYSYYDPDPLLDLDIDGITAEKGETESTTDVDGGEADETEIFPYTTLNAGHSYLGLVDMKDMNGGEADETFREYYSINGGEAYDPDVLKTDAMGSQMFNYMIDGGSAGKKEFINNSTHIQIIGTEMQLNAVISPREDNVITVNSDGLFVAADCFATETEFASLVLTMNDLINKVKYESGGILERVEVVADPDVRYLRIKTTLDPITYNMEYVNDMMAGNKFVNLMHKFVDDSVAVFNEYFAIDKNVNPYAWEEL